MGFRQGTLIVLVTSYCIYQLALAYSKCKGEIILEIIGALLVDSHREVTEGPHCCLVRCWGKVYFLLRLLTSENILPSLSFELGPYRLNSCSYENLKFSFNFIFNTTS